MRAISLLAAKRNWRRTMIALVGLWTSSTTGCVYNRNTGWEFNPFPSIYESIYQQSRNHAEEDYTDPRPY